MLLLDVQSNLSKMKKNQADDWVPMPVEMPEKNESESR
jgi:hypothetical protein